MVRILIVDDHPIVRRGVRQILSEAFANAEFGEAQNLQEALHLGRQQTWEIALVDISMPGRGGLEVLKDLKHDFPNLPVLIVSMHPEDQYAIRALKGGAAGYLTKESVPEELVMAVQKILGGGKYVSPKVAEKLASHLTEMAGESPHKTLSDREYWVVTMIASGKTVSEIAEELSLSVKTISTYRARALQKMKMKTNAQLTHYMVKRGLID
jgi:two-component system, NarL family, invasion response regulator UvrY